MLGDITLRATRTALLHRGWTQGKQCNLKGEMCISYALSSTEGDTKDGRTVARLRLLSHIPSGHSLIEWNDTPGRTFEQVIEFIDETLKPDP